jgi:hypothetical protein
MSVDFDSAVNTKIFYNEYIQNYAEKNRAIFCQIDEENKTVLIHINVYTLITGFVLSFEGNKKYSKKLVFENGKFIVKNVLESEASMYEHVFEPLFNYAKEYKLKDYSIVFNLAHDLKNDNDGNLFINMVLPDEKIFQILTPNKIKLSSHDYNITVSFNGRICIL